MTTETNNRGPITRSMTSEGSSPTGIIGSLPMNPASVSLPAMISPVGTPVFRGRNAVMAQLRMPTPSSVQNHMLSSTVISTQTSPLQQYQPSKHELIGRRLGLTGVELANYILNASEKEDRLQIEERRLKMEEEKKREKIDLEKERLSIELKKKEEKLELEKRKFNLEQERLAMEKKNLEDNTKATNNTNEIMKSQIDIITKQMDTMKKDLKVDIPFFEDNGTDIDIYLTQFERIAKAQAWCPSTWVTRLTPKLKGKAAEVLLYLGDTLGSDYDLLKNALLRRFRKTREGYRQQFRSVIKDQEESFPQFVRRLESYLSRWINMAGKDEGSAEDVKDLIIQEQLMETCGQDLALFIRERKPSTARAAGDLAQDYVEARQAMKDEQRNRIDKCYKCGETGHYSKKCPKKDGAGLYAVLAGFPGLPVDSLPTPRCTATVNGIEVSGIRDTGSDIIIVAAELVKDSNYTGEQVELTLADINYKRQYPLAYVDVSSEYVSGKIIAAVLQNPAHEIIIGNTVNYADKTNGKENFDENQANQIDVEDSNKCAAVQTRGQLKKDLQPTQPLQIQQSTILEVSPKDLERLQKEDSSLEKKFEAATKGTIFYTKKGTVCYKVKKGLLYRYYDGTKSGNQLVTPKPLQKEVLRLAHDSAMAGHQGTSKTQDRIWSQFYWPGMCADVRRYVASCDRCQRVTPKGKIKKLPLGSMPAMEVPFQRVGIDLVGPIIPASDRGNRYILVHMDHASRYPDCVALKKIDSETIAEALLDIWSRVGIPQEVLSDNGKQFVAGVMPEVQRLLSIKGTHISPYNAKCNGMVEKFNGSLKQMLKKLCQEKPQFWDRYLSSVLFAYREVPHETTGFSPFELLYGRTIRGPMHILRQLWTKEETTQEEKTKAQYVVDLRNRLEETCKLAYESTKTAKASAKRYYDKTAKRRTFKEGNQVLLLLPSKNNKLEMEWQGPYLVESKIGECDYKIQRKGKSQIFHGNLLKLYIERKDLKLCTVVLTSEESDVSDIETTSHDVPLMPLEQSESVNDVHYGPLSVEEKEKLQNLVKKSEKIMTDLPFRSMLSECSIKMTSTEPVFTRQYPLPFSQRNIIDEEVKVMLKLGVIEPAISPFSSPIVLVKRKDHKIRFCVDFRKLNNVVEFDGEPMPNVEFLFSKLSKAKYLSKLDLSKGYWQIPMKEEDKPKTAFTTPSGQYQWNVMPFGLKTAGAVFSRAMRKLLEPLNREDIDNFMDDILVATETFDQHLEALEALFTRLQEVNLAVKPSKVFLAYQELDYLGHHVGQGKLEPDEDKMEKIRNAKRPETKKELRAFLGLTGYYRKFVNNYATICLPLTDRTKGNLPNKIQWDGKCEIAYKTLKDILCSKPVCILPNHELKYVLRTDASDVGLGSVLLQDQGQGLQPIAYASRKLRGAELNYATIEKECYGIVWGVQKFEPYLYGNHFILQTDHRPLQYLDSVKSTSGRLTRWALILQPFNFTVEVIPGKDNVGADFLSRI